MRKIRTLDPKLLEREPIRVTSREENEKFDEYRDKLLELHGVECAAWLAWEYRARLRRGAVQFHIPLKKPVPIWFQLGIQTLHNRGWDVLFTHDKKFARWTLRRRKPMVLH